MRKKPKTRIYLPTLTRAIIAKETATKENLILYSVKQYAQAQHVSTDTVNYWIRDHKIQAFKLAGKWVIVEPQSTR
jgi:hypothetical protein